MPWRTGPDDQLYWDNDEAGAATEKAAGEANKAAGNPIGDALAKGLAMHGGTMSPGQPATPAPVAAAPPATAAVAPPAPTPVTPPAPAKTDADLYKERYGTAKEISDKDLEGVTMSHISDSHAGDTKDYLDTLKGRLGGMTAAENQAAMEQGQANVSRTMAHNLESYASHAGGQGVRGAANAALQGRAYQQANQDTASYNRQLILDNIAQKDKAAQAYGGAVQDATNTDLGVQTYNAAADDRVTGLKLGHPMDVMNAIGGIHAETAGDKAAADATQTAKDYIKSLTPPPAAPAPGTPTAGAGTASYEDGKTKIYPIGQHNPTLPPTNYVRQSGESNLDVRKRVRDDIRTNFQEAHPDASAEAVDNAVSVGGLAWDHAHPEFSTKQGGT